MEPPRGTHDVRRRDVAVHHTPAVHLRDRPGQVHRKPDQVIDGQRLRQLDRARAADVDQHDRARIRRRVRQLRDPRRAAQPLEHRQLVLQPPLRVRSQRLLADDRAAGEEQPRDARAFARDAALRCERVDLGLAPADRSPSRTSAGRSLRTSAGHRVGAFRRRAIWMRPRWILRSRRSRRRVRTVTGARASMPTCVGDHRGRQTRTRVEHAASMDPLAGRCQG